MVDPDFERRAARRRATWRAETARSFDEIEDKGLAFWAEAEPAIRLQAMWDAIVEAWIIKGRHGAPPRLQGSACGIGRFER